MQNSESQKSIVPIKIKVNLENMPHKVFRRILVPEDINMMQLHYVVQIAMGWKFAHLFQFSEKRNQPSIIVKIPYEDEFDDFKELAKILLGLSLYAFLLKGSRTSIHLTEREELHESRYRHCDTPARA